MYNRRHGLGSRSWARLRARFFVFALCAIGLSSSQALAQRAPFDGECPDLFWRADTLPYRPVFLGNWTPNPTWGLYNLLMQAKGYYYPTHLVGSAKVMDPTTGFTAWCSFPQYIHESGNFVLIYATYSGDMSPGASGKSWKIMNCTESQGRYIPIPNTAIVVAGSGQINTLLDNTWYLGSYSARTSTIIAKTDNSVGAANWWQDSGENDPWVQQKIAELFARGYGDFGYEWSVHDAQWYETDNVDLYSPVAISGSWGSSFTNTYAWIDQSVSTDPNAALTGWYFDYMSEQWVYNPSDSQTGVIGPAEWYLSEIEKDTGILVAQGTSALADNDSLLNELQHGQLEEIARTLRNMDTNGAAGDVNITNVINNTVTVNVEGSAGTGGTVNVDMSGLESLLSGNAGTGVLSAVDGAAVSTGFVGDAAGYATNYATQTSGLQGAMGSALTAVSGWGSWFASRLTVTVGQDWSETTLEIPLSSVTLPGGSSFGNWTVVINWGSFAWIFEIFRNLATIGLYIGGVSAASKLLAWGMSA